jgi:hypothetical protein
MRMIEMPPCRESLCGTIALSWLTVRKRPGKFCRPRQFRTDRRERGVARGMRIFKQNQSIESEEGCGTALAWLKADGASWECRTVPQMQGE